jgi:tetratricopeptide (TPR) repeat protein
VAYTFIGQSYEAEKNYEKAESWYRRAIDSNYIDYMAHWFLADNLMLSGKKKEAMEQIIIAHILNRNNTKIQNSLETILQANNKKWIDWSFTPQYSLERKGDHDVNIKASLNWFGYALVKSVWKYEPGYKQSMGYDEDNPVIETEEREAILAELQMLQDKNDKELSLDLIAMKKALDKKAIQPYIFYEIFLLQYPSIAYQLPDELIQNIKTYILAVRVE